MAIRGAGWILTGVVLLEFACRWGIPDTKPGCIRLQFRPDGSIWPRPVEERAPRSWRQRGRPAIVNFTLREQRFLRDHLQLFDRGGDVPVLGVRLVRQVSARDPVSRLPATVRGLVQKGFLHVGRCGASFCALFTGDGVAALRALLQTRPPDFVLLFPEIYDALDLGASGRFEGWGSDK